MHNLHKKPAFYITPKSHPPPRPPRSHPIPAICSTRGGVGSRPPPTRKPSHSRRPSGRCTPHTPGGGKWCDGNCAPSYIVRLEWISVSFQKGGRLFFTKYFFIQDHLESSPFSLFLLVHFSDYISISLIFCVTVFVISLVGSTF